MADVKWIKIVTDIFDDEKIRYIETLPNGDETIVLWFRLLCLAGKSNASGMLMMTDRIAYTDEMLSSVFNRDVKSIQLALGIFQNLDMIEIVENRIYLTNWEKHQSTEKLDKIREKTRIRVQEYRKKKLQIGNDVTHDVTHDVTQCNAIELYLDLEEDLDKKDLKHMVDGWFETFWKLYPKKVQRKPSEQKFRLYVTTESIFNAIVNDLRIRVKSYEWTKENGQYVPNPTTYLNQRRWEDELPKQTAPTKRVDVMPVHPQEDDKPLTDAEKKEIMDKLASLRNKGE